jgi:RNase P subunit RPR2
MSFRERQGITFYTQHVSHKNTKSCLIFYDDVDTTPNWFDYESGLPWRVSQDPRLQRRDLVEEVMLKEQVKLDRKIRRQQQATDEFLFGENAVYVELPMGHRYVVQCNDCQEQKRKYQRGCQKHDRNTTLMPRESYRSPNDPGNRGWNALAYREDQKSRRNHRHTKNNTPSRLTTFENAADFFDREYREKFGPHWSARLGRQ